MNPNQHEHSYEELREVVIDVMLDASENGVDRFEKLLDQAALELCQQEGLEHGQPRFFCDSASQLHPNDAELVLEIVWDLFRQGILTLGSNCRTPAGRGCGLLVSANTPCNMVLIASTTRPSS
jgi:hypothetical protein